MLKSLFISLGVLFIIQAGLPLNGMDSTSSVPESSMSYAPATSQTDLATSKTIESLFREIITSNFVQNTWGIDDQAKIINQEKFLACIQEIVTYLKRSPTECNIFASYFSGNLKYEYILLRILLKIGFPITTIVIAEPEITAGFYEKDKALSLPLQEEKECDGAFVAFRNEFLNQDIFVHRDHLNHQYICRFHEKLRADLVFMAHPPHGCAPDISMALLAGGSNIPNAQYDKYNDVILFKAPTSRDTKPNAPIIIYNDHARSPFAIMPLDEWESIAIAYAKLMYCYHENDLSEWVIEIEFMFQEISNQIADSVDTIDKKVKSLNYLRQRAINLIDHIKQEIFPRILLTPEISLEMLNQIEDIKISIESYDPWNNENVIQFTWSPNLD
ncbi:hypothetical protein JST56_04360 [Candidatus Dependentiae bacterium]|nr:hypothetical protein [Candidatus Dependentiae bacterium]